MAENVFTDDLGSLASPADADWIVSFDADALDGTTGKATAKITTMAELATNRFQPVDATLTALAAYNINGLITQTAADTFTGRTITGTASRLSVTNGDGVSGNPTLDIDAAYVGQASITTLGTITTGTWTGTDIAVADGGTGASDAATARTNLGLVAGGAGDIWVEKAGDTMTGNLFINNATLAIGGSAPTSTTQIKAIRTISSASANYGFYADMTNSSSGQMAGGLFQAAATGTGNVIGIITNAVANGTTDTTKASGAEFSVKNLGANDIVDGYGFRVFDATNIGGGRIFDLFGIEIVGATKGLNNNYGLYIGSASGATNNYAIYTNLGLVQFGDRVTIDQSSPTATVPVLKLTQTDISEEMMELDGTTIGTGNAIEAIGAKTLTTTHFVKVTITGVGTRYFPVGTIA